MRDRTFLYVTGSVINHVYIDNLVDAIQAVVAAGDALSGVPVTATDGMATPARDFYGYYAELLGVRFAPTVPGWLAEPAVGGLATLLPDGLRRRLDLDRQSIRYLRRSNAYDTSRLRSLGWAPRVDLAAGQERTAAWLRQVSLLPTT
jgi:nucleoside-diphosphate-sugar epimerase